MSAAAGMNVYAIGASRNIGYFAALRLLRKGATVTYLLRRATAFDGDADLQPYIASGHARLVQGDALNAEDVRNGWEAARAGERDVDLLLFTVGATPSFTLTRGFYLDPPDLCTRALLNTLRTLPAPQRSPARQPRAVVVSSTGITPAAHIALPYVLKPLYGVLLAGPHTDKLGLEAVLARCAGWAWDEKWEVDARVLPAGWAEVAGTPAPGGMRKLVVVRPALLSDGRCMGDEAEVPYRVAEEELGRYYVSRKDVAHFIAERTVEEWDKWEGKGVNIAY